jgi:hypothetical protein
MQHFIGQLQPQIAMQYFSGRCDTQLKFVQLVSLVNSHELTSANPAELAGEVTVQRFCSIYCNPFC